MSGLKTEMPPKKSKSDDRYGTPHQAVDLITPYLRHEWWIWECAAGGGTIVRYLDELGFKVFGTDIKYDFISGLPLECDCIVTNPPYSLKNQFIQRCYQIGKPFALLLPLTALESEERQKCYREYGVEIVIPNTRIQYTLPDGSRRSHGNWFASAWFTWGLDIGSQLTFKEYKCRGSQET